MTFSEHPPSKQWSILSYRGETFAEVWFKPEEAPSGLTFRISQKSFQHPEISPHLTIENLLKAVGIGVDQVESWRHADDSQVELADYQSEFRQPLPSLPAGVAQLYLQVDMKQAVPEPRHQTDHTKRPMVRWQDLEARWNIILGMEVTIDTLRQRMESLRSEIESSTGKSLSTEEKIYAMNSDVAQWNKAKSRVRYVLPRVKEFIHRAMWAMGTPERKKLDEVFRKDVPVPNNLAELDHELQVLLKDRQILSAQGVTAYQDGKGGCDEIQRSLRTLQCNASSQAMKKRAATRAKNK